MSENARDRRLLTREQICVVLAAAAHGGDSAVVRVGSAVVLVGNVMSAKEEHSLSQKIFHVQA